MIPELGHFCLILALLIAGVQAWAGWTGKTALCIRAAQTQFLLCLGAFIALTLCFIFSDLTVRTVAGNSHTLKPLLYKIAGVWGNHEGSMLLWVLVLSFFGFLMARQKTPSRVLSIQGLQGIGFLAFLLFASNPFTRLVIPPLDGQDLNPLLQDPALAIHPPLLYLGYVGFSSVFSFAVALLLDPEQKPADWAKLVRPWVLLSWSALSAGIALGSWWAYYELGWGGFWFWDPVENASLMPWLVGTALLHSIIVTQTRGLFPRWTLLLAILTYSLSLLGTFLVRSGVLTSVHAFAVDPMRGLFILVLLFVFIGGALLLYGLRAPFLHSEENFSPLSRESALLLNNLFLTVLAATVFIGTLYPLLIAALDAGQISVGPPYFHATVVPLSIPLLLLMGIGPFIAWREGNARYVFAQLKIASALTAAMLLLMWAIVVHIPWTIVLGLALSAWLITTSVLFIVRRRGKPLSAWGMTIAHAGLGLAVAGMVGTGLWVEEQSAVLKQGDRISVGRYELTLDKVEAGLGPNYSAIQATLTARMKDSGTTFTLTPERRHYPIAGTRTTETAIRKTWRDDIYVVLGQADLDANAWVIHARTHPLVPMLWLGFAMIALGGIIAFFSRMRARS